MKTIVYLCVACGLGFFCAHVAEYVATHHYNAPIADPTNPSATDVALFTFVGTSLFFFSILQIFGSDRR